MKTIAQINGDMITSRATGDITGVEIPADLVAVPDELLRFDGSGLIALDDKLRDYWIDAVGTKHIVAGDGWQKLKCRVGDELIASETGWRVKSAADTIAEARARARRAIVETADQITARITGQYPAAEVASWPTQEAEARAIVAGAAAETAPLVAALALAAGQTLSAYAQRVLAKSASYRQVIAAIKSLRDATDTALDAATTEAQVEAALASAQASAAQIADNLT